MALKVMLSSVRRGLADVRDAVAPVLTILRYEVIRFETVVKTTPAPPRATCVEMVEHSDIYLLILGEEYGDPMPGTDLAPTEEEWTVARNLGRPIVVFKKDGISPGDRQAAFIAKVENYETGVWRHTFSDAGNLISQLENALAVAAEAIQPAGSSAIAAPVSVPWLEPTRGLYSGGGTVSKRMSSRSRRRRLSRPHPSGTWRERSPAVARTMASSNSDKASPSLETRPLSRPPPSPTGGGPRPASASPAIAP
jgi:hypothetical protein